MSAYRSSLTGLVALSLSVFALSFGSQMPAKADKTEDKPSMHVYPGVQPFEIKHPAASTQAGSSDSSTDNGFGTAPEPKNGATGQTPTQPATGDSSQAPVGDSANADAGKQNTDAASGVTPPGDTESSGDASGQDPEQAQKTQTLQRASQHYELGSHYFGKWDLDLAEVELDQTVCIFPEFKIAHRDLCLLSLAKFNLPRSLAEFMMVTGLTDPTPYSEEDRASLDDKAMKLHYNKALSLGNKDKWVDAITELLWAQTYAPGDAMVHHSLAFAYASSGDFTKAEDEYKLVFKDAPADGMAHADFANMLADHGNPAKAENEMRQAVALTPNAAALHVDLGWLAESRKDFPTAENEFKEAVKLSPKHSGLWTHLARLEEHAGDVGAAEESYTQALQLDSQNSEAKDSLDRLKSQKKPDA